MDPTLPLPPLHALLPLDRPFTRAMARLAGVERASLDRMLREGSVVRLLRGVYASAGAPDTRQRRAAAVMLASGRDAVAVDRTAAWVHGVDVTCLAYGEPRPLELLSPSRPARGGRGGGRHLADRDVTRVDGLRSTTRLRTALDLGRLLRPDLALGAMDGHLALGTFTLGDLLAEVPRLMSHRGVEQLRTLAAQVDARSSGMAESALRMHWHEARLPTPIPGMPVCACGRLVRLSLGVAQRQFGAVIAGQVSADDLVALQGAGWRVVVLSEQQVLHTDPAIWTHHLEREFHQHLLTQVDAEDEVG